MDAPDELVEAIAQAARAVMAETPDGTYIDVIVAEVLACSAIADALERDRKVAEIVGKAEADAGDADERYRPISYHYADAFDDIAALYPETGKPPFDDSDIMPGSEFDGPVIL